MNNAKRIFTALLAVSLVFCLMLSGCTIWKPTLGGTGKVAATYGKETITTGEYLGYLYNQFSLVWQNYSMYEQYGMDPWEQTVPYGEGENPEKLPLAEYITTTTQDTIKRQIALEKLLKENNLEWDETERKEMEKQLDSYGKDAFLTLGISDESFRTVALKTSLNEPTLFYGLYREGGKREVKKAELTKYFNKNYVAYKTISISLTDSEGKELSKKDKQKKLDTLKGYLNLYKSKGFEAAMDKYNKDNASDSTVTPSTHEQNLQLTDATQMDAETAKAVRSVKVGQAKIVEYKASGSATAALIVRLDTGKMDDATSDAILQTLKYDEFNEEVTKAAEAVKITFNKVVKEFDPKDFVAQ